MVRKNNFKKKDAGFALVVVFIIAFGLGFLTNDFLSTNIQENINDQRPLVMPNISERSAQVNVVAVTEDGTGVIGKARIELVSGRGRILANTNPFIEPDTQRSVETAVSYAMNYTRTDLNDYDIIVSFDMTDVEGNPIDPRGQIIGGPSAGAALTISTIAVIQGRNIKDDIAITGTVENDGRVGRVGSVVEKANAAGQAGFDTFLVPQGQAGVTEYKKVVRTEKEGQFTVKRVSYVPSTTSLDSYTKQNYNMSVYEIYHVQDAFRYVFEENA